MSVYAKPIDAYCALEVSGWAKLPSAVTMAPSNEVPYIATFLRNDGIQLICSVKQRNTSVPIIHATLAPVYSLRPDVEPEQFLELIYFETADILRKFFGNRTFLKSPDDPRRPDHKHYFYVLNERD